MKKQPDRMELCALEVMLLPNGEIMCLGKTMGQFRDFKDVLKLAPRKD